MNAFIETARIQSLFHLCQVQRSCSAIPTTRDVLASIADSIGKTGKPVCYNVCVGRIPRPSLFDIARN